MGARKLRTHNNYVELRKIKGHGEKSGSKVYLIIIVFLFTAFLVFSSTESGSNPESKKNEKTKFEPKAKESFTEFVERALIERRVGGEFYFLGNVSEKM